MTTPIHVRWQMDSPSCVIRYIPPRQDPLVVRPVNYTGFIGPPLARDTALWIFRRDVQGRAGKSRQSAHTPSPISFLITQGMGGCVSDPTSDTKNRTRAAVLLLGQRQRRWPSSKTSRGQLLCPPGMLPDWLHPRPRCWAYKEMSGMNYWIGRLFVHKSMPLGESLAALPCCPASGRYSAGPLWHAGGWQTHRLTGYSVHYQLLLRTPTYFNSV